MAKNHTNLLKNFLLAASRVKYTRCWQNDTGSALSFDGGRVISYGLKGSSDILGICNGFMICIEVKIGKDKQRPEQINFQKMIESCGGYYFIIKNEEDINEVINKLTRLSD